MPMDGIRRSTCQVRAGPVSREHQAHSVQYGYPAETDTPMRVTDRPAPLENARKLELFRRYDQNVIHWI
jgi:hypothetical protein